MAKKRQYKIRKKGMPPGTLIYTGHRPASPSTIFSVWYDDSTFEERGTYMPEWRQKDAGTLWIDVRSLSDTAVVEQIGSDFQLHPLALEDVLDTQQRAKIEEYDQCLFFILHSLRLTPNPLELQSEQIAVFLGPQFIVSFQEDPDDTFQSVRKRAQESVGRLRKKGPDFLLYTILDTIVDHYFLVMDDIDAALHELEASLHQNVNDAHFKARVFEIKHIIANFRYRVLPLRDAANRLYRSDASYIDEANRPYLRDLSDHVLQILDNLDNAREMLASVEALYQAEVSNRLNNVMRLLTIISTIFIPLSFIAGVYGMNFDNMPELHWQFGYFVILGLMFCASLAMLVYFRIKRWL